FKSILRASSTLGPEAAIVAPRIAEILKDDVMFNAATMPFVGVSYGRQYQPLVPVFVEHIVARPQVLAYQANVEQILSWGATDEQMHRILVAAIPAGGDLVGEKAARYLWRYRLARTEDAPELLRLMRREKFSSMYGAWCLAEVGPNDLAVSVA